MSAPEPLTVKSVGDDWQADPARPTAPMSWRVQPTGVVQVATAGLTVTVVCAVAVALLVSVTVRRNVYVPATSPEAWVEAAFGAANVAVEGPLTWLQA